MIRAKNYETASTFGKVMHRKLLVSFFPGHGVEHITQNLLNRLVA